MGELFYVKKSIQAYERKLEREQIAIKLFDAK